MEEIHNKVRRWDYFWRVGYEAVPEPEQFEAQLTGAKVQYTYLPGTGQVKAKILSKMVGKENLKHDPNTLAFITSLARDLWNDHEGQFGTFTAFGILKVF